MTNGVVTKTYEQPYEWENLNAEASNTNIRCFLVVEGSYIDFLSSKIGTTGGNVSADKNPKSMVLKNVPQYVDAGTSLEEAMAGVTAEVTFEDDATKLFLLLNLVSLQFLIWILRVQRHLLLHITRRLKVKIAILLLWPMLILRW